MKTVQRTSGALVTNTDAYELQSFMNISSLSSRIHLKASDIVYTDKKIRSLINLLKVDENAT